MRAKTVFIVEDEILQREALQETLKRRGFRVEAEGTVMNARRAIQRLGEDIDVMVLDMRLDDPDAPDVTGADIGIEFRDQHPNSLPEFLINTAHSEEVNYLKSAMRLGTAVYLSKGDTKVGDVVRHVRALALKRSLRMGRPPVMDALRSISSSTTNLSEAVERFCRGLLAVELSACLGAPYILLFTDERGTQNLVTNTDLPTGFETLHATLHSLAQVNSNRSMPHFFSASEMRNLPAPVNEVESRTMARLAGAALVSLATVRNFGLSLALFDPMPEETKYPEETQQLATLVAQYARPTIVEHFLSILVHLDSQKHAMLKSVSYLCLYLGQDQQKFIDEGISTQELKEGSDTHEKMATMADDLWETGTMLNSAANQAPEDHVSQFEIGEMIKAAFTELVNEMDWDDLEFTLTGSCQVKARRYDIYVVVTKLLQWLAQRSPQTPSDLLPEITVKCIAGEESSTIFFEDRSLRLPAKLRGYLFEPFSTSLINNARSGSQPGLYLPLYLAKTLVEEKYGGRLNDESDDMEGELGHRLVMRFSLAKSPSS